MVTGKERRKKSKVMMMMVIGDVTMVTELQGKSGASSTDNVIVTVAHSLVFYLATAQMFLACMKV